MRRNYWVVVASMVVMTVLAGCSDTAVAPVTAPSGSPVSMMQAPAGHPTLTLLGIGSANVETDFSISPWGGVYVVGNHALYFPSHSVCEPSTANYGAGDWEAPCAPATEAIPVHAVVKTEGSRTWVDFTPDLRFVPSATPARWVWLFLYSPAALGAEGDLSRFNILYAASIGGVPVNDAATDSTLRTYVNSWSGTTFRRIKHFSGYLGTSGICDPIIEQCGTPPEPPAP